jgi:hypothetical protein
MYFVHGLGTTTLLRYVAFPFCSNQDFDPSLQQTEWQEPLQNILKTSGVTGEYQSS